MVEEGSAMIGFEVGIGDLLALGLVGDLDLDLEDLCSLEAAFGTDGFDDDVASNSRFEVDATGSFVTAIASEFEV